MVCFFPGEHHGINEVVDSWKIMSPIGSDALVWVVDPSAKPGGVEPGEGEHRREEQSAYWCC